MEIIKFNKSIFVAANVVGFLVDEEENYIYVFLMNQNDPIEILYDDEDSTKLLAEAAEALKTLKKL